MFSMSVATSQQSWGQSMWEEEVSSRMGMSELSSILLSAPGGAHESLPEARRQSRASNTRVTTAGLKTTNKPLNDRLYLTDTDTHTETKSFFSSAHLSCGAAGIPASRQTWASQWCTSPSSTAAGWRACRSLGGSRRPRACNVAQQEALQVTRSVKNIYRRVQNLCVLRWP